jgi:hypothetical protein
MAVTLLAATLNFKRQHQRAMCGAKKVKFSKKIGLYFPFYVKIFGVVLVF